MSGLSCVTFRGAQHKGCLATPHSPPGRSAFCRRRGANRLVDPSALLELTLAPFPPLSPRPCQSAPVELDRAATGAWLRDPEAPPPPPPPKARHRADIPEPSIRAKVLSTSGGRTSARQGCTSHLSVSARVRPEARPGAVLRNAHAYSAAALPFSHSVRLGLRLLPQAFLWSGSCFSFWLRLHTPIVIQLSTRRQTDSYLAATT